MTQLRRTTFAQHRPPALPRPGTQAAAEQHLAALVPDGSRKVAHREHGAIPPQGARVDRPAEWDVVAHWLPLGGAFPFTDSGYSVPAEINHSRWVVMCPHCPSAARVTMADPRFFCTYCGNNDSIQWHTVDFPPNANAIEEVLSWRPNPENRNWRPGETLADLATENVTRGVHASNPEPMDRPT